MTNAEIAEFIAQNGFRWTELCFLSTDTNYWRYNSRSDLSDMTDDRSRSVVETYRSAGVEVAVLGVFTNLIEPDDNERQANLDYFERMIQIAAFNRIPVVATECGFRPGSRGINADTYEADFARLIDSFRRVCEIGEANGVDIALESCVLDVVPSAKRARDFLDQVGSNRGKVLLDPANFIANNTEEEMFEHLAPRIAYLHGKDRRVNDARGRIVGDGDIDWVKFLSLYHTHAEGKPFILEYVDAKNAATVRDRVLAAEQQYEEQQQEQL